jgi:hypothetical protein
MTTTALPTVVDDDETLLDSKHVRQFFGNRSAMWITRREREAEEAKPGKPRFPTAIVIAGRKYFKLDELRAYREACRMTTRLPSPRRPPTHRKKTEHARGHR